MAMISPSASEAGKLRVGIGGWTYKPWRETFYPDGLVQRRELEYASRQVTAIEINGTYYGLQKPASFAHWRDETPDDFVFSLKAPRIATERRTLASAGEIVQRFVASGLAELGIKLGPVLWQFSPSKRFERDDFAAFLDLLPRDIGGRRARHVLDVRNESFLCAEFLDLVRDRGFGTVFTDSDDYPSFADLTADFVYARLMRSRASVKTGYSEVELDAWVDRARRWAAGDDPRELPHVLNAVAPARPRDVFVYFINGAKERAPVAAGAMLARLGWRPADDLFRASAL